MLTLCSSSQAVTSCLRYSVKGHCIKVSQTFVVSQTIVEAIGVIWLMNILLDQGSHQALSQLLCPVRSLLDVKWMRWASFESTAKWIRVECRLSATNLLSSSNQFSRQLGKETDIVVAWCQTKIVDCPINCVMDLLWLVAWEEQQKFTQWILVLWLLSDQCSHDQLEGGGWGVKSWWAIAFAEV